MPVSNFQKISTLGICDGACFSKAATCNFGLLHFVKQWGFGSFVHLETKPYLWMSAFLTKLQTAGFNTNSSKTKVYLFQTNSYKILGILFATEAGIHRCSSKWPKRSITKRFEHRYFPVKFPKFIRTSFLQNTSGGCFCCQNRSKETKRYSKKRYLVTNIFAET